MNINRMHKSNGIYFVVNIRKSLEYFFVFILKKNYFLYFTKIGIVYQKCFDHECFEYKSCDFEIPTYLLYDDESFFVDKVIEEVDQIEHKYQKKKLDDYVLDHIEEADECKDNIDNSVSSITFSNLLNENEVNDLLLIKLNELNI